MKKLALLFSGQGAQHAGMGLRLQNFPAGVETFREADDILGMKISDLCCNGTDEELNDTASTQPAILTCSIAAFRILDEELDFPISAVQSATAGLSVGEYSALVVSEVLSFADALNLVKERGRLMAEAALSNPGCMVAILGLLDGSVVESICEEASLLGVVSPANYNCPGQIVISGEKEAIQKAKQYAESTN